MCGLLGQGAFHQAPGWAGFSTDGLYTQIRAEARDWQGRLLFVGIRLVILFRGMGISWKLKNPQYQNMAMALLAGYAGRLQWRN
ncbi:MAG: hypothetical protein U5L96_03420 [Owenweeksia sp.]|nr:hypothetical protein [Owenweeksia sp.]